MSEQDPYSYNAQWWDMFGEYIPTRPKLGPDEVPMVEECLRTRSQAPYNAWLNELMDANPGVVH